MQHGAWKGVLGVKILLNSALARGTLKRRQRVEINLGSRVDDDDEDDGDEKEVFITSGNACNGRGNYITHARTHVTQLCVHAHISTQHDV